MKSRKGLLCRVCLAWLALAGIVAAASQAALAQGAVVLVGSGSSVPAPLYNTWAQEFNKRSPRVQMRYVPLGTSEGIKLISHGGGDFGAGEAQLTATERKEGNLIELPAVVIGIVPIYNLPSVHEDLRFSGEVLAEIFLGQVKKWNDSPIARLNPGVTLPDLPLKVIHRPAGKGSNYVFSEFLSKTSSKFRSEIGISASPKWPVGEPAERSSDMADKVKNAVGAIGFVEAQYATKAGIAYGLVQNAEGHFVKASPRTLTAACESVESPHWDKFSASLTNAPGADSFPITSFTWLYLRTIPSDSQRAAALKELLKWAFADGQRIAGQEGYAELPQELVAKVSAKASSLH